MAVVRIIALRSPIRFSDFSSVVFFTTNERRLRIDKHTHNAMVVDRYGSRRRHGVEVQYYFCSLLIQ
jgi:hypothetical protein